jgi:hypothetical protein
MSKLGHLSWSERRQLVKVLKPVGAYLADPRTRPGAVIRAINLLTEATQRDRYQWVYWYTLGDFCQEATLFDDALQAVCCSYHLRRHDPRSVYALATGFRELCHARFLDKPGSAAVIDAVRRAGSSTPNPAASMAALARLGLTVTEAGSAAIYFFAETLTLVKGQDRELVRRHLAVLSRLFPEYTPETSKMHLRAPLHYVEHHRP